MRRTRAGDLPLERVVSAMATRPAEILGIEKGVIEIGRDADLIAIDPRQVGTIRAKKLRYKCGWTPFDGMEGSFPQHVYLRGEPIVEQGEPVGVNAGRLVQPSSS
jgi:dihydroorotase